MIAVGDPSPILHTESNGDIWIFGYGSLMWRPDFPFVRHRPAVALRPGLVLGLDRGGACRGAVYRVAAKSARDAVDYLDARERVTDVYHPHWTTARTQAGNVTALTYVPRYRTHVQYAGKLPSDTAAELLAHGIGNSGPGWEYLENTVAHLLEEGIRDTHLMDLRDRVRKIRASA